MSKKLQEELNLGPKTASWLAAVGIESLEDVKRRGVVPLCLELKAAGFPINVVGAYALQAAIMGIHWMALPDEIREQLKRDLKRGASQAVI